MEKVNFVKLSRDAVKPSKKSLDAGYDFYAIDGATINPSQSVLINTGIGISTPPGWGIFLKDRSSMAMKKIHVLGGVIDCPYTGAICAILINLGNEPYEVKKGDRVVQGVFLQVGEFELEEVVSLVETERGSGGFGSTGR